MIILLDLNYTLVDNSEEKLQPFTKQIENERYSLDLISRIKKFKVILITARPLIHRAATLKSIAEKTHWVPDDAYFNEWGNFPPQCKKLTMHRYIFPKYGDNPGAYVAIESNPLTRSMYGNLNIIALTKDVVLQNFKPKT